MRTNRLHNLDLFTETLNADYHKHVKTKSKQALEILKEQIDWDHLLEPLEKEITKNRSSYYAGRNRLSLLVVVRCFLLQRIYGLSDPRLEEEIADRISFRNFLDLVSGDAIPDETTICRYREEFSRLGLDKLLFDRFNEQLKTRGLIVGKGTLVDATLIQAQARKSSDRDKDARGTRKRGKSYYGYKGHIGMDQDTDCIHSVDMTSAEVHDTHRFDQMLHGKEKAVWADKGYTSRERKRQLREKGIFCGILDKAYRNHPLSSSQKKRNRKLSKYRNKVERPFAYFKRVLGYNRSSYYDLKRNRFEFIMAAMTWNIRRLMSSVCTT